MHKVGILAVISSFVIVLHGMRLFLNQDFIGGSLLVSVALNVGIVGVDFMASGHQQGDFDIGN